MPPSSSTEVCATVYKGSASGRIVKTSETYTLKDHEVLIQVKCCGLCYTDVHYKGQDMVLGHEGVGIVDAVGCAVTGFKKGDRVGWGYIHNTCQRCRKCLSGKEIFCSERQMYGTADFEKGGFASHFPLNQEYVFHIPEALPLNYAAPLMCGGATVFAPLWEHVKPTDHVGVVGIGGLGHLAISFASKMGCKVTVFSSTESKREEAMRLGASSFVASRGASKLELDNSDETNKINALLICTSKLPELKQYFPILAPEAVILPLSVGGPEDMISYPYMPFLQSGFRVIGSIIATRSVHQLMLEFAARNKVYPMIEEFPMTADGIESAFKKLQAGEVRYRAVLKAENA